MEESEDLQHVLLEQQTHEVVCPDCQACITHNVIVRKKKGPRNEQPSFQQNSNKSDEDDEPDIISPHMILFEQESRLLICPVCEHAVTGDVILKQRKKDVEAIQSGGRPHETEALDPNTRKSLSTRAEQDHVEDAAEVEDLGVPSVVQDQESYDLLCPDCKSCITHEVILQKRRRPITSDEITRRKKDRNPSLNTHRSQMRRGEGMEELTDVDEDGSPSNRRRRKKKALHHSADPEQKEIRSVLRDQSIYDLTCPDCASRITYKIILKKKTNESGKPVGILEKRGERRQRKVPSYIDGNASRNRYKLLDAYSIPPDNVSIAIDNAQADELKYQPDVPNYDATADSSLRVDIESLPGAIATSPRDDPPILVSKYASNDNSSLKELLLPVQPEAAGEETVPRLTIKDRYMELQQRMEEFVWPAIPYFLVMLFLYFIWWLLRILPPD